MPMSMSSAALALTGAGAEAAGTVDAVLWSGMRAHILLNGGSLQRISTQPCTTGRRGRERRGWYRMLAAAVAVAAATLAQGAGAQWRDIESRIQYGYYTEDATALRNLSETIAAAETNDKLRGYYAGLLAWRQAQLAAHGPPSTRASAGDLAHRCVSEVDNSLALQSDFAEALALRSACLAAPLEASGGRGPLTGYRARKDLDRARELAARNPRVMLVDAMSDYELAPSAGGNKERALPKLRQTVAAFEAERAGAEHLPGWGAAEAWMLLARDLLDHGDPIGARDALEHALLIAPEYAQARRLMAQFTSG
jgi:hypothetical protein